MQWKNKSHELDTMAAKLLKKQEKYRHIYLFGAGRKGFQLMTALNVYGILEGFIDNDIHKQQEGYKGYKVYSFDEYLKKQNGIIIVAVSENIISDIVRQLKDANLVEEEDFIVHTRFCNYVFPIISEYLFDKTFVNLAQISLTERCSLKCKKCAHGCFAVDNRKEADLTLDQVYKSADSFFARVDFIQEFVLIGGEPLLYMRLPDVIEYIGKRYRKSIGTFSITTNGTIIPNQEILKKCREYNVIFHISNYGGTIPKLRGTYVKLIKILDEEMVNYTYGKEESEWMDYGFDYVNRNAKKDELIEVFDKCKTPCREIRENRFYFCVMARSVAENMGFNVGKEDYLDLEALKGEQGKKEFLEFNLGYSEKGYLDMCNYCHGADSRNYPIPAAEQI